MLCTIQDLLGLSAVSPTSSVCWGEIAKIFFFLSLSLQLTVTFPLLY